MWCGCGVGCGGWGIVKVVMMKHNVVFVLVVLVVFVVVVMTQFVWNKSL